LSDWPPRHLRDPAGRWDLTDVNLDSFPEAPHYRLGELLTIMLEHGGAQLVLEGNQVPKVEIGGAWVPLGDQALTLGECFWLGLRAVSEAERRAWVSGGKLEATVLHERARFALQGAIAAQGIRLGVRLLESAPLLAPPPVDLPPPPAELPPLPADLVPPPAELPPPPAELPPLPATPEAPSYAITEYPPEPERHLEPGESPHLVASFNGRFFAHLAPEEISLWSGVPPKHQGSVPGLGAVRAAFLSDSGQLFLQMDNGLFRAGDDWEEIAALGPLIRGEGSPRLGRLAVRRDGAQLIYERIQPMVAGGASKVGRRKNMRRSGHQLMLLDLESSRQRPYFAAESEEEGQITWAASPSFAYLAAVQPNGGGGHQVDLIDLAAEQILARFAIPVARPQGVQVNDDGAVLVTASPPGCWTLARPTEGALDVLELEALPATRVLLAREHVAVLNGALAQEIGFDGQRWRETELPLARWSHADSFLDERSQLLVLGWAGDALTVHSPWGSEQLPATAAPAAAPPPAARARPTLPLAELLGFMLAHRVQKAMVSDGQPIVLERDGRRIPWGSFVPPVGEVATWVDWERRDMGDPGATEFDVYYSQREFRVRLVGGDLLVEPV